MIARCMIPACSAAAFLLLATACRQNQAGSQGKVVEKDQPKPLIPAKKTVMGGAPGEGEPLPNPEQKCGGFQEKKESERRVALEKYVGPFTESAMASFLIEDLDAVVAAAHDREFAKIEGISSATSAKARALKPDWLDFTDQYLLETTLRFSAKYATCRMITDGDPTWCDAAGPGSAEYGKACRNMAYFYLTLAKKVLMGGGKCEEAVAGGTIPIGLTGEQAVAGCQAVVDRKPEACPFDAATSPGAICRAMALRDGRGPCEKASAGSSARWVDCCQSFGWRFASVSGGFDDEVIVPEVGAMAGKAEGCDRALYWNLFEAFASIFGVEDMPGTGNVPEGEGPHADECSLQVGWTHTPVPPH